MSGTVEQNPTTWGLDGNMLSTDIGEPSSTTAFTPSNCALTVLTPVLIGGNTLTPIQIVPDW